ncbi:hypothetical protein Sjap_001885 [Stephania japonica]|uniref:Uncharacterized protein n=1 Tax=Stephania japonica TaxID=461633 RepID=A0AAP0PTP0_9MAGN
MDGRSTIPRETRQAALLLGVRKLRARNFEKSFASLTTEPSERQRLYPRLYEGNDRQGFASTKRQAGQSFGAVPQQRHTEVRDEGDQFDRQRQDQQGRQDRHPGQQRGDEGHVVYATAPAPVPGYGRLCVGASWVYADHLEVQGQPGRGVFTGRAGESPKYDLV